MTPNRMHRRMGSNMIEKSFLKRVLGFVIEAKTFLP
jgi:hypothetical protein